MTISFHMEVNVLATITDLITSLSLAKRETSTIKVSFTRNRTVLITSQMVSKGILITKINSAKILLLLLMAVLLMAVNPMGVSAMEMVITIKVVTKRVTQT